MEIRRGDVVLVPFPYVTDLSQAKTRPALVIQNDIANQFSSTVILALISSTKPSRPYPMHYSIQARSPVAKQAGLTRDSIVKTETIITLPKEAILRRLGSMPKQAMIAVDKALSISIGLTVDSED